MQEDTPQHIREIIGNPKSSLDFELIKTACIIQPFDYKVVFNKQKEADNQYPLNKVTSNKYSLENKFGYWKDRMGNYNKG